ncbi:MAG: LpxL/LpxP family Kdo(2)-lipid IV(A) lauroyl/palmitoleoyl acyltransferase [Nitrospira sp.]|nr:LpxL/LpxP family Kdo(2)-lipid IV(A) lauroyl/palmitoleoyl acyltransferase [Nitrospira sp.]HQY59045.1 LpxL/LpxP family Kdo(2)-lipid IV(A) lauroyl/palmitoleoyl acyltransferase [Nitrospira sp.]HRA97554.1 LpxL/LpxP family Kdo(2)-lipid IV(A) lauroyl/palmitoleoyl acyltransferase [Nitrospira sp.]
MSSTNTRKKRPRPHNSYHPLYWPTWVGLGLFRLLSMLPYRWQLAFGRQCGRLLHGLLTNRRDIVRINLAVCFPQQSSAERNQVALHCFESMGMGVLEIAMAWWAKDPRAYCECTIKGLEHIHEALRLGRGVLLCGAHLHAAELAGRFMALEQPVAIVYRPQNDVVAETVANRCRSRYYSELIQHRDMRGILRALAKNQVVWYAPDIDAGSKRSVFAPFFGVQAASLTATSRLAKVSGAAVVPCFYYRRADRSGYDIEVGKALDHFPSGDMVSDAARINRLIEGAVLRVPEQYFWQHRRFKSRPPGEPPIYQR